MNPSHWLLIAIITLFLNFFIRSFYLIPIAFAAISVAFIHAKLMNLGDIYVNMNLNNIYLEFAVFFIAIFFWNLLLKFPRKWINIFMLKMRGNDIDQQRVRTITVLREGEIGKAKWSGVTVNVMLSPDNIDKEIPEDFSMKVVKLNRSIFIVTNNHY